MKVRIIYHFKSFDSAIMLETSNQIARISSFWVKHSICVFQSIYLSISSPRNLTLISYRFIPTGNMNRGTILLIKLICVSFVMQYPSRTTAHFQRGKHLKLGMKTIRGYCPFICDIKDKTLGSKCIRYNLEHTQMKPNQSHVWCITL